MNGEKTRNLSDRTVAYGIAAIGFCEGMPNTYAGKHVANQLLRAATSVAANYAEATEAESAQDFIHKLKLAQKELKESMVWLQFASRINRNCITSELFNEANELKRMIASSINTAKSRL